MTLVAVAVIPVLSLTVFMVMSLVERERATMASGLQDMSRALALAVDLELEGSITTLQGLATSVKLSSEDYPAFSQQLERARAEVRRNWQTAAVLDPAGRLVVSLDPPLDASLLKAVGAQSDFLTALATDRPWISDRLPDPSAQTPVILVAVPVARDRTLQHILLAVLQTDILALNLVQHRLPGGISAHVLDRSERFLLRLPMTTTTPVAESELATVVRRYSPEGFGRIAVPGSEGIYAAVARAPLSGWTVTLVVSESTFEAPWRRWLMTMIGGGVVLLLIGLGLATLAARRIARPIAALSVRARALGRGEATPATFSGIAEVDEVERAIIAAGSARELAESAVRQSEARLHTTLRDIGDAVLSTDADGSVRFMNRIAEALLGWTLEEVQGRALDSVLVLLNEATRERVENPVARVLRDGTRAGLADHTLLLDRHGREVPIDDSVAPIRDDLGRLVGVVLVFRDVADRRRAEDALRTSEARYRAIVEDQTELVCRVTPRGVLTFVNAAFAHYFGRSPDALVGERLEPTVHPDDRERVTREVESLGAERPVVTVEHRSLDATGNVRWTQWSNRALCDLDGRVVEIQAVGRDITDRKRAEQALERSTRDLEARARQQAAVARLGQRALEGTPLEALFHEASALLCATLEAEFCTVLELRENGVELETRASVGWPVGARPLMFGARAGSQMEFVLRTRKPLVIEHFDTDQRFSDTPWFRKRGIASGMSVVIHGGDRPYGVLGIHTGQRRRFTGDDVNFLQSIANIVAAAVVRARAEEERRELLERAQQARVAAEEANRAKDEFLAMLSHELRNPLGAIVNASRLLERTGETAERTVQLGSIVARQSQHLARMVDDLLDVSRLSSGKIVLRRELVDLKEVVERSAASLHEAGRSARHEVRVAAESVFVYGDATRLGQIVWNLLDNALKYTPPGGLVEVTVTQDGAMARLRVRDTGVGIAPEILPHIFELFVQARRSLDRAEGGLGLGLTLVRRLVQLHGGTVSASSAGNAQGSAFEVQLPVASRARASSLPAVKPAPGEGRRVLVVEDNPDARETLALLLESWGHHVEQAGDGESALARAANVPLDVALIDVGLPGMDGYEVARQLRTVAAGAQLQLVALTGYSREEDRRQAREAGFDAYLVKPVDPDQLVRALDAGCS